MKRKILNFISVLMLLNNTYYTYNDRYNTLRAQAVIVNETKNENDGNRLWKMEISVCALG